MQRVKIPFFGSFQKGSLYRNGNTLNESWRYIQRIGTIDNIDRIAKKQNIREEISEKASLKFRQGIELRESSLSSSILTKPLLLYYSCLNLIRGVLLASRGDLGDHSHGLKYEAGESLLQCKATVLKNGTFIKLLESFNDPDIGKLIGKSYSLEEFLLSVPEIIEEISLITQKNLKLLLLKY
jgi:hypothetical protein